MRRKTAIYVSGVLWFAIGCLLLYKGLRCIAAAGMFHETAMTWVAVGLLLGFIKGRFVLSKAVKRFVQRIATLSPPIRWTKVYPPAYGALIGAMVLFGMVIRFFPLEWRGMIDVAIGSALMHGAMLYFRAANLFVQPQKG